MRTALAAVLLAAAAGCAGALVVPDDADVGALRARFPGTTLADLQRGRTLYVSRCAACHHLHLPAERAPDAWPRIVEKMAPDANLSGTDLDVVERYLMAASARR